MTATADREYNRNYHTYIKNWFQNQQNWSTAYALVIWFPSNKDITHLRDVIIGTLIDLARESLKVLASKAIGFNLKSEKKPL